MKKVKLQKIRLEREITQDAMANLLHMKQATYSRKERGLTDMTEEDWEQIAKVLGVDKSEIYEDNPKKGTIANSLKKQYSVVPTSLMEKIDFLTRENLELKEKLKKFESQNN